MTRAAALACMALCLALASGCSAGRLPVQPVRQELRSLDPLDYAGTLVEGWYEAQDGVGYIVANAWDDSTIDVIASMRGWALWGPAYDPDRYLGDRLHWVAVFSLHLEPDSSVTSLFRGAWMRDELGAATIPLPDSLGTLEAHVAGAFSTRMAFYVEQACCDTMGEWYAVYDTTKGLRLEAHVAAPKLQPSSVYETLKRVGPHHGA